MDKEMALRPQILALSNIASQENKNILADVIAGFAEATAELAKTRVREALGGIETLDVSKTDALFLTNFNNLKILFERYNLENSFTKVSDLSEIKGMVFRLQDEIFEARQK